MSNAQLDTLVVVVAVILIVFFVVVQPMVRRARRDASLAAIAPFIGGTVAHGRVTGVYRDYSVEAWPFKAGVGRSEAAGQPTAVPGDRFTIRLLGVQGSRYWRFATTRVKLFGTPDVVFTSGLEDVLGGLGRALLRHIAALPTPDPELEGRLRSAGMSGDLERLQQLSKHLSLSFMPHDRESMQLRPGGLVLSEQAAAELGQRNRLELQVEQPGGLAPSADRFQELLDLLVHVAETNARANPACPARAAVHNGHLSAEQLVGTWSNGFMALTFNADGTVVAGPRLGRRQQGTWQVANGRLQIEPADLNAEAWVEGDQLMVTLGGMTWTLERKA